MTNDIAAIQAKANAWTKEPFDAETRKEVTHLLANDEKELVESFYTSLEFGTGGMRGIMGVGTNRMNVYTVGMATQGLCNYLLKEYKGKSDLKAVVGCDSRNNSTLFAKTCAQIFAANGIQVYLFESLRPTPEISFAIRHYGCHTGLVLTASHNPKEYNGYKAYWNDGGQVVPPHDKNIIKEVNAIQSVSDVKWTGNEQLIKTIGKETDEIYISKIVNLSLSKDIIKKHNNLKIVFSALHGTGITVIPETLKRFGFNNVIIVPKQDIPDGNFPTVKSPNPEESEALTLGIQQCEASKADILLATDPDADRVGVAIRNNKGEITLLNGNQTGAILVYYLCKRWTELGKLKGNEYIIKTIVTTELIADIAKAHSIKHYDVLTGFKYIAEIIKEQEGKSTFIFGGEESYGYLMGDFVRDKDAVMACAFIAEAAAWAADKGKSMWDLLMDIYKEFGLYKEKLLNITKKGKSGQEEIQAMMSNYRSNPPKNINNTDVLYIHDYQTLEVTEMKTGHKSAILMPTSNVLQFTLADGTKISVRPSGTEPKIKFYFGVKGNMDNIANFDKANKALDDKIEAIKVSMGLI